MDHAGHDAGPEAAATARAVRAVDGYLEQLVDGLKQRGLFDQVNLIVEGWRIATRERYERDPTRYDGGAHGYDNRVTSMGAVFIGRGPAFTEGLQVGPFANTQVYNLMATILGVTPAPNDGDREGVRTLLKPTTVHP